MGEYVDGGQAAMTCDAKNLASRGWWRFGLILMVLSMGLWIPRNSAEAATGGPASPSVAAGTGWTAPANATASDNLYATYSAGTQDNLVVTGFGFALPAGATINGITVEVEGNHTNITAINRQFRVSLTKDGATLAGTTAVGEFLRNTDSYIVSGSTADLWGTTWTAVEINAGTFGILVADNDLTANGTFNIDHIRVTVTYTDTGGWADSPLLHNSNRFPGTTKWGGDWGTPTGKYGAFVCGTCHGRSTGNIKRVKKTFTAPNGTDQFPIEADATPPAGGVNFQDVRDGSSDFGDDSRVDKSQSDHVCEACHTYDPTQTAGVKYHGYDMSAAGDPDHYNMADCMTCHPHNAGFKPSACDSCHGNPPTDTTSGGPTGLANSPYSTGSASAGAHAAHAVTLGYACTTCHNSYSMPQESTAKPGFGDISINFNTFGVTTGSYSGHSNVSYNDVLGTGSQTCSNLYCHSTGQSANGASATPSAYSSPTWSTPASGACGTCHSNTDPATGSHTAHVNDGATCGACHSGNNHVDRVIDVTSGTYTAGGAPGNGYGTCSTASCHDPGRGALVVTPAWGTTAACTECHAAVPTTGGHGVHVGVSFGGVAIACADCHTGTTQGTTAGAGHRDGNIDVTSGGYPVDKAKNTAFTSCSTASCHQSGITTNAYVTTPAWDQDTANCTQCHAAVPATGSHAKHVASTNNCSACHTNAVKDTSYNDDAHGDLNIDVAVGGYAADKAIGSAYASCSAVSCHSDGLSGTLGNTPVWGATAGCAACHASDMTTGSHTVHLADGATCGNCHSGAVKDTTAPAQHTDGNVDVYVTTAGDLGYTQDAAIGSGSWSTCNAASCHDQGRGGLATTPAWGVSTTDCTECHAGSGISTGSHASHLAAGSACTDCHDAATDLATETAPAAGHRDTNIDTNLALGYTQDKAKNSAYTTCATASCHNDGRNSGLTGTWGTAINNCAECHATVPATGSHTDHLALYACGTCHTGSVQGTTAPTTGHRDGNIDTAASTGLTADKLNGSGFTSCGVSNCHGSNSPTWGTDLDSYDPCTQCHGQLVAASATDAQKAPGGTGIDTNGDSAATDPQVGAHQIHLNPTNSKAVACSACHQVPATITAAGHIDSALPAEVGFTGLALGGLDGQAAVTPSGCATTYCHDGAAIKNGWDGGTLTPVWTDVNFIQGTAADCDNCHGYPPTPASGHPSNTDCSICHDVLNADDVTFTAAGKLTHVDGIVQASGGDSCTDCHAVDVDGVLNGSHARHSNVATFLSGKTISGGGYGGAGWYATTYTNGQPMFGCGQCHPANEGVSHPLNGLNVDIDPAGETPGVGNVKTRNAAQSTPTFISRSSVTCASVYCHSDAAPTPTYKTTPDWYGGMVSGNCTDCHGNSPTTNAHAQHAVGIHYNTLYDDDGVGLMATSPTGQAASLGADAAHGNSATSNTIGCQTCHNATVTVSYNAANSVCGTCHSDTNAPATGNEKAVISTTGSTHVNGQADVTFSALAGFKSKSQLRNDIATVPSLTASWTRTNGYKDAAGTSYDAGKALTPGYSAGSCSSVACHNGLATPAWNSGTVGNCLACHTSLPQ